ncbi:MAG: hypothetical protein ACYTAF_07995 [Planctomycetota bacterium]|jgi:hypothetical protein
MAGVIEVRYPERCQWLVFATVRTWDGLQHALLALCNAGVDKVLIVPAGLSLDELQTIARRTPLGRLR